MAILRDFSCHVRPQRFPVCSWISLLDKVCSWISLLLKILSSSATEPPHTLLKLQIASERAKIEMRWHINETRLEKIALRFSTHSSGGTGFWKSGPLSDPSDVILNASSSGNEIGSSTNLGHFSVSGKLFPLTSGAHFPSIIRFVSLSQHLFGVLTSCALDVLKYDTCAIKTIHRTFMLRLIISLVTVEFFTIYFTNIPCLSTPSAIERRKRMIINDVLTDKRQCGEMGGTKRGLLHLISLKCKSYFIATVQIASTCFIFKTNQTNKQPKFDDRRQLLIESNHENGHDTHEIQCFECWLKPDYSMFLWVYKYSITLTRFSFRSQPKNIKPRIVYLFHSISAELCERLFL